MEQNNKYLHRELSWLEFNRRVLEEAKDEAVPLLERVKFLAIFSSNLDEFFMVRVSRIKRQLKKGIRSITPDGLTPAETLSAISKRVHELAEEQHLCFINTILPQLTSEGIHLVRPQELNNEQGRFLEDFFNRTLYPILTPLAIDPGHPFPYLANRSLYFVVSLHTAAASRLPHADLSILHIPTHVVPRFISLRRERVSMHLSCWRMFCGATCRGFITALKSFPAMQFRSHETRILECRVGTMKTS